MHFHLPKPLHGWREFFGEVGVIVIGVLIALGAEQLVEDMRARADAAAFRETVDHEVGLNLFLYDVRARQFACDDRRADELRGWLAEARSGKPMPALYPLPPGFITPYRSAWDNRNAQVFNTLPAKQQQKYAEFYDELSNNWVLFQRESEEWHHLDAYAETGPLTLADRRTIRPIILQIANSNDTLANNVPVSLKIAQVLGVKEVEPDGIPPEWLKQLAKCRSVIASPTETISMNARG